MLCSIVLVKVWVISFAAAVLVAAGISGWFFHKGHALTPDGTLPLYLTWHDDPTTTMTVCWLSETPDAPEPFVFYRANGDDTWRKAPGSAHPFPHTGQTISQVDLAGLQPGTRYEFHASGTGEFCTFETLPATLEKPLRFEEGGDAGENFALTDRMNALAGSRNPAFVVLGGDLAYCNGEPGKAWRWKPFLQSMHRHLRAPDGRLIPVIVAMGNHEVRLRGKDRFPENLPTDAESRIDLSACFHAAFPFPGDPAYGVLDAGDYLSLVILDSEHLTPVAGAQTEWLARTLEDRKERPNIIPIYHVPAYPAKNEFDHYISTDIRRHWVPLFEKAGIHIAFEHHEHVFKVTHPIRDGKVDPKGIVYLGDGAWGNEPRAAHPAEETWHLAKAGSIQHLHEITLEPGRCTVESLSIDGETLNILTQATP